MMPAVTNQLTGRLQAELGRLWELTHFRIERNNLTGDLDGLFCVRLEPPLYLTADCGGPDPEVICGCCSSCCQDGVDECT